MRPSMLVIGLTGGIGSGKSTVAKLFIERGITVIDTDQLARDVTQRSQPALKEIAEKFGPGVLQADGGLNRNALRKIIFADDNKRIWLENLLHPLIYAEMEKQINRATSPYCIVVIPLLLEKGRHSIINRVLIVDTAESAQIKRTNARDNSTVEEVKAILETQVKRPERLAGADDIIENNGSISDLVPQVESLHGFYTALAQKNATK